MNFKETQELKTEIAGALARGYTSDRNSHKILDPELIADMADRVYGLLIMKKIIKIDSV